MPKGFYSFIESGFVMMAPPADLPPPQPFAPTPPPGLPLDNLYVLVAMGLIFAFCILRKINKKTPV